MPVYQSNKVSKATKALVKGSQDVINEANRVRDIQLGLYQPYSDFSKESLNALRDFEAKTAQGDYSMLTSSPEYQFKQKQGINALDRTAGARGGLYGGQHMKDVMDYSSGLASQEMQNVRNRMLGNVQLGYPAIGSQSGIYGTNLDYFADATNAMAQARAGKQIGQGNIWGKFFSDVAKGIGKGMG